MLRILTALLCLTASLAQAQDRRPSHCIAIADAFPRATIQKASFRDPLPQYTARVTYIGHASFLIQSTSGVDIVTDFTGFTGSADFLPDVVTMNHAHDTHWTAFPDPDIPHVLRGWGDEFGTGIEHYLTVEDVLIRNVSTDIRGRFGGAGEPLGNSIFIFEAEGLCIGHLGHLHHEPTEAQYAAIGRLDVVMVPVDGGYTLDVRTMTGIVQRLRSSVVIPMHWFSETALDRRQTNALEISLRDLPDRPTVIVLRPRYLRDDE